MKKTLTIIIKFLIKAMKYFTMAELSRSATAESRGIDNAPSEMVQVNLEALVENVLDPLREAYGSPITVTSGYRSPQLNSAVDGVANSQHLVGQAADITAGSKEENKKLFELVKSLELPFDQLIDEHSYSWLHISYNPTGNNRGQILHL